MVHHIEQSLKQAPHLTPQNTPHDTPKDTYGSKARESGQGLIEYIALTALVAIVSIGTVKLLGNKVKTHLNRVANSFDRTVRTGLNGGRAAAGEGIHEDDDGGDEAAQPSRRGRRLQLPGNVSLPW